MVKWRKCLIESKGRKTTTFLSSDAIFLNVSGFFLDRRQREAGVSSVTRRNRGNDRSDCRLSGVAETTEQQREAEGSDMSDTWSVDSSSLSLSVSSSSEFSRRISLLPTYPSGISLVELVSLDLREDPFSRSKNICTRAVTLVTILHRTSYNYGMIHCFIRKINSIVDDAICNAN